MSDFDPFDTAPADAAVADSTEEESVFDAPPAGAKKAPAKKAAPKVSTSEEGKITITFKGTGGYADRWVVVHASDAQDGLNQINDPAFKELLDRSWKIAEYDGKRAAVAGKPASGGGGAPSGNGRPSGAAEPPSWMPPAPGEGWEYKSRMKKDGSGVYHAWAPPRGVDAQWQFHNPPKK